MSKRISIPGLADKLIPSNAVIKSHKNTLVMSNVGGDVQEIKVSEEYFDLKLNDLTDDEFAQLLSYEKNCTPLPNSLSSTQNIVYLKEISERQDGNVALRYFTRTLS